MNFKPQKLSSWVWKFENDGHEGLVFGMVNNGIASVPGVLLLIVNRIGLNKTQVLKFGRKDFIKRT